MGGRNGAEWVAEIKRNMQLTISLSSIAGCTFHNIKNIEHENFAEDLVVSSLLGFATALSQVGQFEIMSRILL